MSEPLTLPVEEAGRLLGISRGLAYELVRRGEIPSVRLGRRLVVPRRALEAMLDVGPARVLDHDAEAIPTPATERSYASSEPRRARRAHVDTALPFTG